MAAFEELVLAELKALRKRSDGASLAGIASSPTMCQLLGDGDPALAMGVLQDLPFRGEYTREIDAACFSLGLASKADTHLGRLEAFAAEQFIDQRQARRLSDKGLVELARLITTNWVTFAAPCLAVVVTNGPNDVSLFVDARCSWSTHMESPTLTWTNDSETGGLVVDALEGLPDTDDRTYRSGEPIAIGRDGISTATIVWRGDQYPKFEVVVTGLAEGWQTHVEAYGSKLRVRARPSW